MFKYTPEMQDFIRQYAPGKQWHELADLFNVHFGTDKTPRQIQAQAHDIGVRNGLMKKNKLGVGRYRPVGSTRLDKDGYVVIKTADPCTWRRAQFVEWEKYHEPIDIRKEMLLFLDGDRQNHHISNLYKIPRKYIAIFNRNNLWRLITPETIESVIRVAEMHAARWDAEIRLHGGENEAMRAKNLWRYHNIIKKDPDLLEKHRKGRREYARKFRSRNNRLTK